MLFWLQQLTGHPIIKSSVTLTATFGPHGFPVCAVLFTATFGPHGFPECCPLYSNFWASPLSSVLTCLHCDVLVTAVLGPQRQRNTPLLHLHMQATQPLQQLQPAAHKDKINSYPAYHSSDPYIRSHLSKPCCTPYDTVTATGTDIVHIRNIRLSHSLKNIKPTMEEN